MASFGHFLGGMQEGMSERRKFELDKTTKEEELALGKRRLGLQAAEAAASRSMAAQRLAFDREKEAADNKFRTSQLTLQERQINLQAEQQKFVQDQSLKAEADKVINGLMDTIKETSTQLKAVGKTPDEIFGIVQPMADRIKALSDKSGLKGDLYLDRIQTMLAQPSAGEIARSKGATEAQGALSQAKTLEEGGVSRAQALESSGIKTPTKVGEYDVQAFRMPDGTQISVRKDDGPGMTAVIQKGGVPVSLTVRADSAEGLTPVSGPSPKDQNKAVEGVRKGLGNVEELERTMGSVAKNQDAVGIRGQLIELGGGIANQIPIVGEAIVDEALPQYKDVVKTRAEARTSIAQSLLTITGDPSRYTDNDVKLAKSTLRALETTSDWKQVVAAYQTVIDIQNRQVLQHVDELRVAAKISVRDLGTDDGINRFADILVNRAGVPPDRAERMILDMLQRFGIKLSSDKSTK